MVTSPHRAADWLYFLLGIAGFALPLIWFGRSKSAGPILLDVRDHDSSRVVLGIVMFALGLSYMLLTLRMPRFRFQGFYWLGYGAFWMGAAQRRFQIGDAGIFSRRLFRWEDIQEYYLSPGGRLSLNLRDKGWTNVGGVPRQHRQRASELLSSRLPAQHVIAGF